MASQLLNIAEIKKLAAGEQFKAIFVMTSLFQKTDKNGKGYYEASVSDATGTLDAKIWSDASWFDRSENSDPAAAAKKLSEEKMKALVGCSMGIDGKTAEYRGQLQFNFNKLTLLDQEKFSPSQYLPRSPLPQAEMEERYEALVSGCRKELADFLRKVYSGETWREFRDWPAAVNHHHAYANGLLEHTLSVTDCAKSMAESLKRSGYDIDVDLVVTGSLLHDLGKIDSYKINSIPEMTLEGAVLDHVALGYSRFMELAEQYELAPELKLQLAHIILSHHGQREYGSPVIPATPEAMIVSSADELDFRMFCWKDAVKDLTDDQPISQWNFSAQRRFWKR